MSTYCFDVVYQQDWGHFKVETEMPDEVLDTLQYLAQETIRRNGYILSQWGESLKNKVLKNCDAELNGYEFDVGIVKDFICDEDDDSVWFREYPEVRQSDFDVRYPPYNQDDYKYFDTYEEVEEIIKKLDKTNTPYKLDTHRGWGVIVEEVNKLREFKASGVCSCCDYHSGCGSTEDMPCVLGLDKEE